MTCKGDYDYIRQRNAGALPWEIESKPDPKSELGVYTNELFNTNNSQNDSIIRPLPDDFYPDEKYLNWLEQHHGIPKKFALDQIEDFKFYWKETGEARKAWQNRFKNHVMFQWQSKNAKAKRTYKTTREKLQDTSWANDQWFDEFK